MSALAAAAAEPQAHVLVTGRLSLAALEELRRRVAAGEDETQVRVELLLREHKAAPWA